MNERLVAYATLLALSAAAPAFAANNNGGNGNLSAGNEARLNSSGGQNDGWVDPKDNARYNGRDPSYERQGSQPADDLATAGDTT